MLFISIARFQRYVDSIRDYREYGVWTSELSKSVFDWQGDTPIDERSTYAMRCLHWFTEDAYWDMFYTACMSVSRHDCNDSLLSKGKALAAKPNGHKNVVSQLLLCGVGWQLEQVKTG